MSTKLEAREPDILVKGRKVVGVNHKDGTIIEGEFYAAPVHVPPSLVAAALEELEKLQNASENEVCSSIRYELKQQAIGFSNCLAIMLQGVK